MHKSSKNRQPAANMPRQIPFVTKIHHVTTDNFLVETKRRFQRILQKQLGVLIFTLEGLQKLQPDQLLPQGAERPIELKMATIFTNRNAVIARINGSDGLEYLKITIHAPTEATPLQVAAYQNCNQQALKTDQTYANSVRHISRAVRDAFQAAMNVPTLVMMTSVLKQEHFDTTYQDSSITDADVIESLDAAVTISAVRDKGDVQTAMSEALRRATEDGSKVIRLAAKSKMTSLVDQPITEKETTMAVQTDADFDSETDVSFEQVVNDAKAPNRFESANRAQGNPVRQQQEPNMNTQATNTQEPQINQPAAADISTEPPAGAEATIEATAFDTAFILPISSEEAFNDPTFGTDIQFSNSKSADRVIEFHENYEKDGKKAVEMPKLLSEKLEDEINAVRAGVVLTAVKVGSTVAGWWPWGKVAKTEEVKEPAKEEVKQEAPVAEEATA